MSTCVAPNTASKEVRANKLSPSLPPGFAPRVMLPGHGSVSGDRAADLAATAEAGQEKGSLVFSSFSAGGVPSDTFVEPLTGSGRGRNQKVVKMGAIPTFTS